MRNFFSMLVAVTAGADFLHPRTAFWNTYQAVPSAAVYISMEDSTRMLLSPSHPRF